MPQPVIFFRVFVFVLVKGRKDVIVSKGESQRTCVPVRQSAHNKTKSQVYYFKTSRGTKPSNVPVYTFSTCRDT